MNFILAILLLFPQNAVLQYVDHFATEEECLIAKTEQVKAIIPRDVAVRYVASCSPVRNGTDADA